MGDVVAVLTLAGLGVLLGGLALAARRARRGSFIGAAMGAIDEIWHPNAHASHIEIQVQDERKVPIPSPGDRPFVARPPARG